MVWSEKRLCEVLLPPASGYCLALWGSHEKYPLGTEWVLSSHGELGAARGPQPPSRVAHDRLPAVEWGWGQHRKHPDPGRDSQAEGGGTLLAWESPIPVPSSPQKWTSALGPTVGAVSSGASTPWAATSAAVTLGTSWPPTSAAVRVSVPRPPQECPLPHPKPSSQISHAPGQNRSWNSEDSLEVSSPLVDKEYIS